MRSPIGSALMLMLLSLRFAPVLAVDHVYEVVAGGDFSSAGGTSGTSNVARWDGSSWRALQSGVNSWVYCLAVVDTVLFVGGVFETVHGVSNTDYIAQWSDDTWSGVDGRSNEYRGSTWALLGSGSTLYIAGGFIARWTGGTWYPMGSGVDGGQVRALVMMGTSLYVGGSFSSAGGVSGTKFIARWSDSAWHALGGGELVGEWVAALAVVGTTLYVGGSFGVTGLESSNIAKWEDGVWSTVTSGVVFVNAMTTIGSDLFVGGSFSGNIAKWNGGSWNVLGGGTNGVVRSLAALGTDLAVGGDFSAAGGISASRVAKWSTSGGSWSALGTGTNGKVNALVGLPVCPVGSYGQDTCQYCLAGTFSSETGSISCEDCPVGTFSSTGATDCTITITGPYISGPSSPPSSPISGGTSITIPGYHFDQYDASSIIVRLSNDANTWNAEISGTRLSSRSIRCITPTIPSEHAGSHLWVDVKADGADWTYCCQTRKLLCYEDPIVQSHSPKGGPIAGASVVGITGTHLDDSGEAWCRFGSTVVTATIQGDDGLQCTSPSTSLAGEVVLSISLNNQQWTTVGTFKYYSLTLATLVPSCGPVEGLTGVEIQGTGIIGTGDAIGVTIGTTSASGTYASGTVSFLMPSQVGNIAPPSTLSPSLALNGQQYQATGLSFLFYEAPYLSQNAISPSEGSTEDDTEVTISGSFRVTSDTGEITVKVVLGNQTRVVDAVFYDQTTVIATLPAMNAAGVAQLSVALNGQQYTDSQPFDYVEYGTPCSKGEYSDTGYVPCEPCAPGFFAPSIKTVTCTQCPRNHYCPIASEETTVCPDNTISDPGSPSNTDCKCRSGAYEPTLEPGQPCKDCSELPGAVCAGGTSRPYPQAGYWNSGDAGDLRFYRCPAGALACLGGSDAKVVCEDGYRGRMCSACVTPEAATSTQGYYKLEELCLKCPENPSWTIWVAAFGFFVVLYMLKRVGVQGAGGSFGIGIAYIQVTALFADFRLQWPPEILAFLSQLSVINVNVEVASPECSLGDWGYAERFAFTMVLPWAAILTVVFYQLVSEARLRLRKRKDSTVANIQQARRGTIHTILIVLQLMYITISSKALEPFDCTLLANGQSSLDSFPDMECWVEGGEHMSIFPWAILCTVVYVIGIPVGFLVLLYWQRKRIRDIDDEEIRKTAGVLFVKFLPQWYWWEAVIMVRKLLIVFMKLNLTNYPLLQAVAGILIILIALILHFYAQPFARRSLNRLAASLLIGNFLVLLAGLMFLNDKFEPPQLRTVIKIITLCILGISFTGVAVFMGFELKSTYQAMRAKKKGEEAWKDSRIWQHWKMRLQPRHLVNLQEWLASASSEEVKQVEGVVRLFEDPSPNSQQASAAVMGMFIGNHHQMQHVLGGSFRVGQEVDPAPKLKVLGEFFVAIGVAKRSMEMYHRSQWFGKNNAVVNESVPMKNFGRKMPHEAEDGRASGALVDVPAADAVLHLLERERAGVDKVQGPFDSSTDITVRIENGATRGEHPSISAAQAPSRRTRAETAFPDWEQKLADQPEPEPEPDPNPNTSQGNVPF